MNIPPFLEGLKVMSLIIFPNCVPILTLWMGLRERLAQSHSVNSMVDLGPETMALSPLSLLYSLALCNVY